MIGRCEGTKKVLSNIKEMLMRCQGTLDNVREMIRVVSQHQKKVGGCQ